MDVPADILEKLKCHHCDMYLSRGPVNLEHGGAAACGLCFSLKRPATRNNEYEAVAKLLRFPCKNRDLGCRETVGFEEVAHEARCSYRQYVCPVLGSSRCEWLGTRSQLLQHCQEQHPHHVLGDTCSLTHNISTSSMNNYVLQAFQLLFLLLTKVCVQTGRIYHAVRLLDSDDMAQDFRYKLHVRRGDVKVIKRGDVAPQRCLALQESTALGLEVESWGGATCTVTVERRGQQQETVVKEEQEKCSECGKVEVKLYRDLFGWQCASCAPIRVACRNQAQGCTVQDIPDKCWKHEDYFCQHRTMCWMCGMNVSRGTLFTHYTSRHVTHRAGTTWRATRAAGQYCLVTCPAGTAVCWYRLYDSGFDFDLRVYMPVLSERLSAFRCEIRVSQPNTGVTHSYTPDFTYIEKSDWRLEIKEGDFPSWIYELDVCICLSYKL